MTDHLSVPRITRDRCDLTDFAAFRLASADLPPDAPDTAVPRFRVVDDGILAGGFFADPFFGGLGVFGFPSAIALYVVD